MRRLAVLSAALLLPAALSVAVSTATVFSRSNLVSPSSDVVAQDIAPIEADLYARSINWSASPGTMVAIELRRQGARTGYGQSRASDSGDMTIWLDPVQAPHEPRVSPYVHIRPGDSLVLMPHESAVVTVTVPSLVADIDPLEDRVFGTAPPGSSLLISVSHRDASASLITETVESGMDGTFEISLAGSIDAVPGHHGVATLVTTGGHRFTAQFAVLEAEITLESNRVKGRGTPGNRITVTTQSGSGSPLLDDGVEILDGIDWEVPYPLDLPLIDPITAGTRITLTYSSSISATDSLDTTVPDMSVTVNDTTNVVRGTGPVSATLQLVATAPTGDEFRRAIDTDASGAFSIDLSGDADLGPGWIVAVSYDVGNGVRVRARDVLTQVRVWVHDRTISGTTAPGSLVRADLFSPDGQMKTRGGTSAEADGTYLLRVGRLNLDTTYEESGPVIEPGDYLEVYFGEGDPIFLRAPEITAVTDADAETVSGRAPVGSTVRVTAGDPDQAVERTVTSDDHGEYVAALAGTVDIEPPSSGTVVVSGPGRHVFLTGWAAPRLSLTVSASEPSRFYGNGPPGRRVAIALRDEDGNLIHRSSARVQDARREGGRASWGMDLVDETDQPIPLRDGDTLVIAVGDDGLELIVPPIEGAIHIDDDRVIGHTLPNAPVSIFVSDAWSGTRVNRDVVSDGSGFFAHSFGAELDLQYNSSADVTVTVGRNTVRREISSPGITLDLDQAVVRGAVEPALSITVKLLSGGRARGGAQTTADGDGLFEVVLVDQGGHALDPQPGDQLVVQAPEAQVSRVITFTVPELTIDARAGRSTVLGRASHHGHLSLWAESMFPYPEWGRDNSAGAQPEIRDDGGYSARLTPPVRLEPGWRVHADYFLPSGHRVTRARYVPIMNVHHGGAHVCGFGEPGGTVDITAEDRTGDIVSRVSGSIARNGSYDLVLRDVDGSPIAMHVGTTVTAQIGDSPAAVVLPPLDMAVDWSFNHGVRVTGTGPPNRPWAMVAPVRDCFSNDLRNGTGSGTAGTSDDEGRFEARMQHSSQLSDSPCSGLEMAFLTPDAHRFYRQAYRTRVRVYVHTDRVTGLGTPLDSVAVSVTDETGAATGSSDASFDADGKLESQVSDTDGMPVAIRPGYDVVVQSPHDTALVEVEELNFDFDTANGFVGRAPPGREVAIDLALDDGRSVSLTRRADSDGRFYFSPSEISPRATWSFADLTWVEMVFATTNGHEIGAEAVLAHRDSPLVFMPFAVAGR